MSAGRRFKKYGRSAGLVSWEPRDELVRSRRWAGWAATGLGVLSLLFLTALLDTSTDPDIWIGVVTVEALTIPGFVFALRRFIHLRQLVKQVDDLGVDELQTHADALRRIDESVLRIGRLVSSLRQGAVRDAGQEALLAAEKASATRHRLLRRRVDLEHLLAETRSARARRALAGTIAEIDQDLSTAEARVEDVGAAVAQLVDAAETDLVEDELQRLQAAVERMEALRMGLAAVDAIDPPPITQAG